MESSSSSIDPARIQPLNDLEIGNGEYVLYWMQQSQRAEYNHALEFAIQQANRLRQCVLVCFGITDKYPDANLRHYAFMLEGLRETQESLSKQHIKMVIRLGSPSDVALALGRKASLIVCDRGYLQHQKAWRQKVAHLARCRVVQVESDVVVPVEVVSQKAEYAARTIRPRIHRHLDDYLVPFYPGIVKKSSLDLNTRGLDITDTDAVLTKLSLNKTVPPVTGFFKGGTSEARQRLDEFIRNRFSLYMENRNQPQTDDISHMSPYLHFGQISPLYIASKIRKAKKHLKEAKNGFLEELIVRRELAVNFVNYNPNYDSYECLPQWAKKTLQEHQKDQREYIYSRHQLEAAETHDEYWNAAMLEMKHTGFMHNYMRMYWGKKILEWSTTPEQAFRTALAINNKYLLDGRDPNSYAGVAWVFGMHDRAWFERSVFGKIRYMSASGLERKCDIRGYVKKVGSLI